MTKTTCVFCAIIAGETPAAKVFESDVAVAFLDVKPLFKGHVLVVPRRHVVTLPELDEVGAFFECVQKVSRAVPTAMQAQGTFVALNNIVSQSVPHLHVHVVPRTKGDGLKGFFWPRTKYASTAEMAEIASRIHERLTQGGSG